MRRARITYEGAYHHVMNRGHDGLDIFYGNKNKSQFLEYLAGATKKMRIRILAYCVMDNHFHLVIENSSGKMSECLKQLNGDYGMYYRKTNGGCGYVFQNRFKSTLIENDAYLIQSILYLLQNPVRAGIVPHAQYYTWSSIGSYLSTPNSIDKIVDRDFVIELFGTAEDLSAALNANPNKELPIKTTKYGEYMGSEKFFESAKKKYDRRAKPSAQSHGTQRTDDQFFEPVDKVIWEFEKTNGVNIEDIDTSTFVGKGQRGELLVLLKERSGLTYKEIHREFGVYSDLKFNSLREIYRNHKGKRRHKGT